MKKPNKEDMRMDKSKRSGNKESIKERMVKKVMKNMGRKPWTSNQ